MPADDVAATGSTAGSIALVAALLAACGAGLWQVGGALEAARAEAERERWRAVIETLAPTRPDNDPLAQARTLTNAGLLDTEAPATLWPLVRDGARVGTVVRVPVPEGYNGALEVVVGVDSAGLVTGVMVPRHGETPAYGGRLASNEAFLARFRGAALSAPADRWRVSPGDGAVDGTTGATVTMTAITNGVLRALRLHQAAGE